MESGEIRPQEIEFQAEGKQKLETQYGTVSYLHKGRAENINTDDYRPLVVVPGWGITLNSEKPYLDGLVEAGKDVIALEFSRGGSVAEATEDFAEVTTRKAEMLAEFLSQQPDGKYDLSGQSEGAMVILSALAMHPELIHKVKNLVFASPAGLTGDDSLPRLMTRYLGHLGQDNLHLFKNPIQNRNVIKMGLEAGKYVGKNIPRSLKEANAIANTDVYDLLQPLSDQGVGIAIIQGEDDKLTPAKKLWNKIGEGAEMQIVKDESTPSGWGYRPVENQAPPMDSVTMVGGGHDNRIYTEKEYAGKVVRAISGLDSRHQDRLKWKFTGQGLDRIYDKAKKAKEGYDHEFSLPKGRVRVIDKTPEEVVDETPVLYAPGWMGTLLRAENTMDAIVSHKRRAVTVQYMRESGKVEPDRKNRKIELQKAGMLDGVIDAKQLGRVDVIAHSEGAVNALIAACAAPEKFRNIVLMNPAGLIGHDNPLSFLWRFAKSGKDSKGKIKEAIEEAARPESRYTEEEMEKIVERDKAVSAATSKEVGANKKMFASEIGALADSDIFEMLEYLRDHDVKIAVVAGASDQLFPIERMGREFVKRYGDRGNSPIEGFYSIKGTHADIYSDVKFTTAQGEKTDDSNTDRNIEVAMDALRNMQRRRAASTE